MPGRARKQEQKSDKRTAPLKLPDEAPPIIYIRWRDACFSSDVTSVSEAVDLVELHEVGWFLGENEEAVTIGMEWEPGMTHTRFYLTIPKVNITEFASLVPGKGFRKCL